MIWSRQDLSVTNFDTVGSLDFGLFEITILDCDQLRLLPDQKLDWGAIERNIL